MEEAVIFMKRLHLWRGAARSDFLVDTWGALTMLPVCKENGFLGSEVCDKKKKSIRGVFFK
jgi:hypothetical protein